MIDETRPETLIEKLSVPFPNHALKQREGAFGKMLTYVEAETVIRRLNKVCPQWSFRMTGHEWTDPIEWVDKKDQKRSSRTLIVWGELGIPGIGTRTGTGVQVVDERSGEDLIKGALSDCLKNAAKHFNVGIDLYGPDLEAGEVPNLPTRARTTTQNTVPANGTPPGDGITDKQMGMIRALAEQKGVDPQTVRSMHGKASAKDLTRQEASTLITRLQEL